jgi:hypothetical protein
MQITRVRMVRMSGRRIEIAQASFKMPRRILDFEAVPVAQTGKVQRAQPAAILGIVGADLS